MASETINALLMIALFGVLETALYFPHLRNARIWKRLRGAMVLHWPAGASTSYALSPVRVRGDLRRH